ncbi:MAG: ATP-binding protein [Thermaerobacterales bacterium]
MVTNEVKVPIRSEGDIVRARQKGRELGAEVGHSSLDATMIATAISELARNILVHADQGDITIQILNNQDLVVIASDRGPGIPEVELAIQSGYSTVGGLGLGLFGVRQLMDEVDIATEVGRGTTITARKIRRPGR